MALLQMSSVDEAAEALIVRLPIHVLLRIEFVSTISRFLGI